MVFGSTGVPECDFVPSVGMFRVRKTKGKHFSSGGFGMTLAAVAHDDGKRQSREEASNKTSSSDKDKSATVETATAVTTTTDVSSPATLPQAPHAEYLFIEEALFLFERGLLDVYGTVDGNDGDATNIVKLNAFRLYGMLELLNVPLPIYLAYAHLRAQDYRVLRHVPSLPPLSQTSVAANANGSSRRQQNYEGQGSVWMKKEARRTLVFTTLDNDNEEEGDDPTITFDVYLPNSHFKKTRPGKPDLHVAVTSYARPSPTWTKLQALLMQSCRLKVPLRIATVSDCGVVVMFGVTNEGVPDISNNGHGSSVHRSP